MPLQIPTYKQFGIRFKDLTRRKRFLWFFGFFSNNRSKVNINFPRVKKISTEGFYLSRSLGFSGFFRVSSSSTIAISSRVRRFTIARAKRTDDGEDNTAHF
jgi:ABC-type amino acid transport system permease subunit